MSNDAKELKKIMKEITNVRHFQERAIDETILQDLYEAFSLGPASISNQARELYRLRDQELDVLIESSLDPYMTEGSHGSQSWLKAAPFVAVVLIEKRRAMARIGDAGIAIAGQEAEAAIQNFRLMARFHHLATASVREFDREGLRDGLQLPWYVEPVSILVAGYSDQALSIPPRLSVAEIVSEGKWE